MAHSFGGPGSPRASKGWAGSAAPYSQCSQVGLVMHMVSSTISTIDQLNLPPALKEITLARRGITIVTGPSGSGKSSTLAALVDQVNEATYGKIVTIEDPIEVLHSRKRRSSPSARSAPMSGRWPRGSSRRWCKMPT